MTLFELIGHPLFYILSDSYYFSFAAIASMKAHESRTCFAGGFARRARSPVIVPSSITSRVAFSSFFAKSTSSGVPSSSPRFARAPVHAKIVATGFVDVFSPLR